MVELVAEIGLNYAYGSDRGMFINNVFELIDLARIAGFNYVKLQKRSPKLCVPESMWNERKMVPWRECETTYIQYKEDVELTENEYESIMDKCNSVGIGVFVSAWDKESVDFWSNKCSSHAIDRIIKIPSAKITDIDLCRYARKKSNMLLVSTGMSTETEIERCVHSCEPDVIFHTNSSYPSPINELNLNYITHLKKCYPEKSIGYSGHEYGLDTTIASVALGATWIERHITMSHDLWGSDQKASIEPVGMFKLVKGVRELELALGNGGYRIVTESEIEKKKSLR